MAEKDNQDAIARQWLLDNPNDPAAPRLRDKMRAKGLDVPDPSNLGAAASAIDPNPFIKGTGEFLGGLPQGLLGIPEAIYQFAEKAGAPRVPEAIRAPLRQYRDWTESTAPGVAGEVVGNIPAFLLGGEVLDALGVAGRIPRIAEWAARNPRLATTLKVGGQSTIAQPSRAQNLPDFLTEKGEQFGLGAILGHILGRPVQRAAHEEASAANTEAARAAKEQTAQDEENRLHANEIATRRAREDTAADIRGTRTANAAAKKAVEEQNAAAQAAHAQTVATEKEQHQALSEAQQAFHTGEREKAQAAAAELSARKQAALDARDVQREAKLDVPAQTTQGWWQRTGARIGEAVPTDAKADTGAHVQKAVGDRLNSLTDRMNLDPESASLTEELQEIRRTTSQGLQEHNRAGFFNQPQATPLERIVLDAQGRPQPRTAAAPEPPPSGKWADRVLDPLKKGVLTGKKLTEYITSLGNEANTLATRARAAAPGSPEAADLLAQATAYRRAQDTVIGHAAGGNAEDKLALEQARQAYMMWGVGNDAAKASRGGVATPSQMIDMMVKRLGEARYKQALADPQSPFHDELNWLQQQRDAHAVRVPRDRDVTRPFGQPPPIPGTRPTPIPPPSARRPPTEIPLPTPAEPPPARQPTILGPEQPRQPTVRTDPGKPNYPRRGLPTGLAQMGAGGALWAGGHPILGPGLVGSGIRSIIGRAGGEEGSLESVVRRALQGRPRVRRAARGAAATAAEEGQRHKPTMRDVAKVPQKVIDALRYAWPSQ